MDTFLLPDFGAEALTIPTILIRIIVSVVLGGFIGIERGIRNRPAGFRTHILVCVGACLVMLTNEYIFINALGASDPTRMGAQVISGIGFLGVGTIFMSGKNTVKGLTTAAGLWASACVGLAVGIGFYLGGIAATAIILIVLELLQKLETVIFNRTNIITIYVEFDSIESSKNFIAQIIESGNTIKNEHLVSISNEEKRVAINITIKLKKGVNASELCKDFAQKDGVLLIEVH